MDKQLQDLISNYKPSEETIRLVQKIGAVFFVGISGAGKDTIINLLLQSEKYHLIVSHTTRAPRKNRGVLEQNGREYHFVNHEQVKDMLQKKQFVEAKLYNSNIYGTAVSEFVKAAQEHKTAAADIEVQGVDEYMSIAPDKIKPIFLLPPDFTTWQSRFNARYEGVVDEAEFQERLLTAQQEIKHVLERDYYSIVINDDLDKTLDEVRLIAAGNKQSSASQAHSRIVAEQLLKDLVASSTH